MSYFRHPKTQNERKGDQAVVHDDNLPELAIKARLRSTKKVEAAPPTDWSDIVPAARSDRSRGKRTHSAARKAKAKAKAARLK